MTAALRLFGDLFPLLDAYPTVDALASVLPAWHRWHRRPDRVLADLGLDADDGGGLVCIRRLDVSLGFEPDNVVLVEVPDELRPYHRIEHEAWSRRRGEAGR